MLQNNISYQKIYKKGGGECSMSRTQDYSKYFVMLPIKKHTSPACVNHDAQLITWQFTLTIICFKTLPLNKKSHDKLV